MLFFCLGLQRKTVQEGGEKVTIEEKERFLMKPSYTAKDIMDMLGCKKTWATQVMNECRRKFGGLIPGRNAITPHSFWLHEHTTLDEQLRQLSIAKGYAQ